MGMDALQSSNARATIQALLLGSKAILNDRRTSDILIQILSTSVEIVQHPVGHKSVITFGNGVTGMFLNKNVSLSMRALYFGIKKLSMGKNTVKLIESESAVFRKFVYMKKAPLLLEYLRTGVLQILDMKDIKIKIHEGFKNLLKYLG